MSYLDHLRIVVQHRRGEFEKAAAIRRLVQQRRATGSTT